jgi:hypothetical protein
MTKAVSEPPAPVPTSTPPAPTAPADPPEAPESIYWGDWLGVQIWVAGALILVVLQVSDVLGRLFRG